MNRALGVQTQSANEHKVFAISAGTSLRRGLFDVFRRRIPSVQLTTTRRLSITEPSLLCPPQGLPIPRRGSLGLQNH